LANIITLENHTIHNTKEQNKNPNKYCTNTHTNKIELSD
jgi:hypothetical protein